MLMYIFLFKIFNYEIVLLTYNCSWGHFLLFVAVAYSLHTIVQGHNPLYSLHTIVHGPHSPLYTFHTIVQGPLFPCTAYIQLCRGHFLPIGWIGTHFIQFFRSLLNFTAYIQLCRGHCLPIGWIGTHFIQFFRGRGPAPLYSLHTIVQEP